MGATEMKEIFLQTVLNDLNGKQSKEEIIKELIRLKVIRGKDIRDYILVKRFYESISQSKSTVDLNIQHISKEFNLSRRQIYNILKQNIA